jgi:hypothetical protein
MRGFKILRNVSNYFAAGASAAGAAASVAGATAVVSAAGAAAVSTATAVVSTAGASTAASSAFLQETVAKTATNAKLKSTFFILLNYKRLIINSEQRYKFFNR